MNCHLCGAELSAESKFCHQCGAQLPAGEDSADTQAVENPPPAVSPVDRFKEKLQPAGANDPTSASNDDEAERDLWQGGFSHKAMIGEWLLAGAIRVC